ncbi:MAG: DUF805 domain-containing protein [Treponema sp.]|nr:DUF805 domain-containing protein [Treponema sp.]
MNNKKVFSISILFFVGAALSFAVTLLLREFSSFAIAVLDFMPEIALGIFLLTLSKSAETSYAGVARKILSVMFIVCVANAVFQLIADIVFMVMIETPGKHEALVRFFVLSSYLKLLPFARILSDIPALVRGFLNPFFVISLLGDALVLAGFIRALLVLRRTSVSEQSFATPENLSENPDSKKMMSFSHSIETCFKKYFSFHGCATRAEYWWFQLFIGIGFTVFFTPAIIALAYKNYGIYLVFMILGFVFTVATILPSFSVSVRRMHDTGNMGFLAVIPIANLINLLLPSLESSEYRSGYNIHPTANFLGKVVVILSLVSYIFYMGTALSSVFFLSNLQGMNFGGYSSDYDFSDDEDNSPWWEDDEDSTTEKDEYSDLKEDVGNEAGGWWENVGNDDKS